MLGNPKTQQLVAVTGASGYLGKRVVPAVASMGMQVISMSRQKTDGCEQSAVCPYNERHPIYSPVWVQSPATCIHLAGLAHSHARIPERAEYLRANFSRAVKLARAARNHGCRHFVLVSSVSVYGPGAVNTTELTPPNPDNDYGLSKQLAEAALRKLASATFAITIVRLGTLFGGTDDPGNVQRLHTSIRTNRILLSPGQNQKCLLNVVDAARGIAMVAAEDPAADYQIYNLAGRAITMRETFQALRSRATNRQPAMMINPRVLLPIVKAISLLTNHPKANEIRRSIAKWCSEDTVDSSKFCQRFGTPYRSSLISQLTTAYTDDSNQCIKERYLEKAA